MVETQFPRELQICLMGLELMVNRIIVGGAAFWHFTAPDGPERQVVIAPAITAMAIEMAAGFAFTTAVFRARDVDMTDMAASLKD